VVTLSTLTDEHVGTLLRRAVSDPRGLGDALAIDDDAVAHLVRTANGDARRALTGLEAAATAAMRDRPGTVGEPVVLMLADAEAAVQRASVLYDKDGDQHYDVISAFIKSIRGSDPDAALHYLARMLEAGEDPRFVARRLMISASEDIGMADPNVLQTALSDRYPEYRLVCQTAQSEPRPRAVVLSALHANVQDVFHESGVQISLA